MLQRNLRPYVRQTIPDLGQRFLEPVPAFPLGSGILRLTATIQADLRTRLFEILSIIIGMWLSVVELFPRWPCELFSQHFTPLLWLAHRYGMRAL